MKKLLLATAVAAAISSPAMAQNVSISGYLEAGYEIVDHNTPANELNSLTGANMFGSNRLVIAGSEDLGAGLKAGFRLESGLNLINGQFGSATLGAQGTTGPIFDRGAEINFSGAFGTIAVGKLDHRGIEDNDLNVVGNISLADATVEVGGVASDVNGTVRYLSPDFSGFTLDLTHTPRDNANANTFASSKGHAGITSGQLRGKIMNADVRFGYGTVKNAQTDAGVSAVGNTKVYGIAVAYDFGALQASFLYQSQDNPAAAADTKQTITSVKIPLSNGWDIRANYDILDTDGASANDRDRFAVAAVKALSKRTNLFAYYQDTSFDVAATSATSDTSRIGLRVSHSF